MKRCIEPNCSALTPHTRCSIHQHGRNSMRLSGRALMAARASMAAALRLSPQPCPNGDGLVTADAFDLDHIRPIESFPIGTPFDVVNAWGNLRARHVKCNRGAR